MSIFKKAWEWLRSLFARKKKKEEAVELASPDYRLCYSSGVADPVFWNVVTTKWSPWCSHSGLDPVEYVGFTRLMCVRDGGTYKTAAVKTVEAFGDGRFECEARFKPGKGTWPAIWMSHPDSGKDYETYFEIDLSEYYEEREQTDSTYHFPKSMRKECDPVRGKSPIVRDGWNHFVCEWNKDFIRVLVNGVKALEIVNDGDPLSFPQREEDRTFRIILSMQYESKYLQAVDLDELPLWMDVRNIKIYEAV